jgi:hypothetical protein
MRRALLLALALALASACVYRPRRVELHTYSRPDGVRQVKSVLEMRYSRVNLGEADVGRLSTDDRYESQSPVIRNRAYVAIAPGEFGWAAEITVVREVLDGDETVFIRPSARWVFDGCDSAMEDFLAHALETWLREDHPVFVESEPASAPSRPKS